MGENIILQGIVAMNPDGIIGKDGTLPWRIPEDLQFFKKNTENSIIVMGRKTFDSLKNPLINRIHIVISRTYMDYKKRETNPRIHWCNYENVIETLEEIHSLNKVPTFIIGGAEIFKMFENNILKFYITMVYKDFTKEDQTNYVFFNKESLNNYTINKASGQLLSISGDKYEFLELEYNPGNNYI